MNVIESALLGLLQGLGEFLPISSSGHLLLGRMLLGLTIDESPAYKMLDILLHVGTLIPILIVFWKDWWSILKNPFKSKTLLLLFVASMPTLVVKVVFDDFIDGADTGWFLGVSFLMTAVFLLVSEIVSRRMKSKTDKTFALITNVSKSFLNELEEKTGFVEKAMERARQLDVIRAAAEEVRTLPGGEPAAAKILAAIETIKE